MDNFTVDLSALTPAEIRQFKEDPSTLRDGHTCVCLYLRYSSDRQTEQSIEGQLRDGIAYCKARGYRITGVYVDRATSAHKDISKRTSFLQMIADSKKGRWAFVLVWKLDRFARNRTDSAIYKARLKQNGVRVLSVTENISDNPEGIILEAVLEGMAEFYSAELSQKITRGMRENALKGLNTGGQIPLGYKSQDRRLVVDPVTAPIVREAFELYAAGHSVADICQIFNEKGYRSAKGTKFNRSSFTRMFRNRRYIGLYQYKEIELPGVIPAIISPELFEEVARRMEHIKGAPARGKAKVVYHLAGKLFCGHCGAPMNGESGTGHNGIVYNYYKCYTRKRSGGCDKLPLRKEWLERAVAEDAMRLLNDETISELADMAMAAQIEEQQRNARLPVLRQRVAEIDTSISNLMRMLETVPSETMAKRLLELEEERRDLDAQMKVEEAGQLILDRSVVVYWLNRFKDGDVDDEKFRAELLDLLVNSVTVWDDPDGFRITTVFNLVEGNRHTFTVDKSFGFGTQMTTNACIFEIDLRNRIFMCTRKHLL